MQQSAISLAVTACLSLTMAQAAQANQATQSQQVSQDVERITVYGKQNKVVMNSGLATKSDMSLMETPAALVVIDKELFAAQGADSLQDLVRNISGVTQAGNNYGIGDNLVIRGLDANYTYDGMYGGAGLGNTFNPTRSMTNVEAVEVLKGPATGLYGMGSAGGIINLIEKKPQFQDSTEVSAEAGSWNSYSLGLDSTGGLSDTLAYRLVAKHTRSDGYRDIGSDRDEVYASLKILPSNAQDLVLSAAWIKDSVQVDSVGHPIRIYNAASTGGLSGAQVSWQDLVNDPNGAGIQLTEAQRQQLADSLVASDGIEPFDIGDTSLASPISRPNEGEEWRFKLNHNIALSDNLQLNQQLQYRDYQSGFIRQTGAYNYVYWKRKVKSVDVINADPRAPLVIDDVLYPYAARRQEYRKVDAHEKSWQYFADMRYNFSLAGIDSELLLNANLEDRDIAYKSWVLYDKDGGGELPYILDIRNPNWGDKAFEDYNPDLKDNYNKQVRAWGLGMQYVGYLSETFTARVGVAFNEIEQKYSHLGTPKKDPTPEQDSKDHGITYNLGLTYMPTDNLSFFVNHAKGRTAYSVLGAVTGAQSGRAADRKDSESLSYDLGMRVKGFDDQLLGSLVLFQSERTNLRYGNPEYNDKEGAPDYNISVPEFFYDGKDKTTGAELDLNAHLNEEWLINLNGLYQDARNKNDPNASGYNSRQKGVPQVSASAWVTYSHQWQALPHPVSISFGVRYVDERSTNSDSFGIPDGKVPAYTVWDSAIAYKADDWNVQLNLNNLFNTRYYDKAMFLGGMPGAERNAKLSVSYRF